MVDAMVAMWRDCGKEQINVGSGMRNADVFFLFLQMIDGRRKRERYCRFGRDCRRRGVEGNAVRLRWVCWTWMRVD